MRPGLLVGLLVLLGSVDCTPEMVPVGLDVEDSSVLLAFRSGASITYRWLSDRIGVAADDGDAVGVAWLDRPWVDERGRPLDENELLLGNARRPARESCARCQLAGPRPAPLFPGDACSLPEDTRIAALVGGALELDASEARELFADARVGRRGPCAADAPPLASGGRLRFAPVNENMDLISRLAVGHGGDLGGYGVAFAFRRLPDGSMRVVRDAPIDGPVDAAVALEDGRHLVLFRPAREDSRAMLFDAELRATPVAVAVTGRRIAASRLIRVPVDAPWAAPGAIPLLITGKQQDASPMIFACSLIDAALECVELPVDEFRDLDVGTIEQIVALPDGLIVGGGARRTNGSDLVLAHFTEGGFKVVKVPELFGEGTTLSDLAPSDDGLLMCRERGQTIMLYRWRIDLAAARAGNFGEIETLGSRSGWCGGFVRRQRASWLYSAYEWLEFVPSSTVAVAVPPLGTESLLPIVQLESSPNAHPADPIVAFDVAFRPLMEDSETNVLRVVQGPPGDPPLLTSAFVGEGPSVEVFGSQPLKILDASGQISGPVLGLDGNALLLDALRASDGRALFAGFRHARGSVSGFVSELGGGELVESPGRLVALAEVSPGVVLAVGDGFRIWRIRGRDVDEVDVDWDDPTTTEQEQDPNGSETLGRCHDRWDAISAAPFGSMESERGFSDVDSYAGSAIAVGCPWVVVRIFAQNDHAFARRMAIPSAARSDQSLGAVRMFAPDRALIVGAAAAVSSRERHVRLLGRVGEEPQLEAFEGEPPDVSASAISPAPLAILGPESAPVIVYTQRPARAVDVASGAVAVNGNHLLSAAKLSEESWLLGGVSGRLVRLTRE
ncbi:MAG: hypothetical protein HYV07_30760 [Deltaproteobacteria bacterium]|nr:hypothetical protein [Deltaproteobacteria bacterium]